MRFSRTWLPDFPLRLVITCLGIALLADAGAQVPLAQNGAPAGVILLRPSPPGHLQKAAEEFQLHLFKMSGATLPIDTVGSEGSYPGKAFVYLGASTAATAAGVTNAGLELEFYRIRTVGGNLYIVGRDGGQDEWFDLTDCQPGTLLGVEHFLCEVLGVRWLWPGDSGVYTPHAATVTAPALDLAAGPAMLQRKYRTPRIGMNLSGADTYGGSAVPVLPESDTRKTELAMDELLWLRRLRMGTRKSPQFAHSFTQWWSMYGASHPEYFAELLPGKSQPHPASDRVKLHDSSTAVYQQKIDDWVAGGAGSNLNICLNDSRSFCVCAACRALDRPPQAPEVVFDSSEARLGDRVATFYTEIANRAKLINPNVTVYGYAYDVYRYPPLEATVPDNVALAYIPGAPSDTLLSGIQETEDNILGWFAKGCQKMYLRPNWMLSGHCGPFWPTRRVGEHFKRLLADGNLLGFDSDSTVGSYAGFGLYYYLICRLIADPTLSVDAILDEYCSAFGPAAGKARDYFAYWENFLYNEADSGNTTILGYASCVPAYGSTYRDEIFDGALSILNAGYALLAPGDTEERARLDFLNLGCIHGRLTAQAIALVDQAVPISGNPEAARALRSLLAYRNLNAESFAVWREWMIDRESSLVPGMGAYWASILANPDIGNGSNVGAFIESGGQVVMEAEHATAVLAGTGVAAGIAWQEDNSFTGASGAVMQALPNNSVGTDTQTNGPRLDFKVDFHTVGTYYVFLHLPTLAGGDDSVNIGLDGVLVASNLGNTTGSWRWRTTNPATIGLNITTPGARTFNIWMREDGCVVDKVILTTNATFSLAGADLGPAESGLRGNTEHFLTVVNGTGDGAYGEQSLVPIAAGAPPTDQVFDHWAGDTAQVANPLAASTQVTMGTEDIEVSAVYRLDPALDTDGDGMRDDWENTTFMGTAVADAGSDFDHDGQTDLEEFLAGTDARDPASRLAVAQIQVTAAGDVTVAWPGAVGRRYTLLWQQALDSGGWSPIAPGIPGAAPLTQYTVHLPAPAGFLMVRLDP